MRTEDVRKYWMRLKLTEVYGLKSRMRKELRMYQPVLKDNIIRTIYRVKRAYKEPMTRVAESLMQQGLSRVDKEQICKICISEGNNNCNECYLAEKGEVRNVEQAKH